MKPSLITAAARKALIAADSMYHAWPKEQQEHFRANMDEAARLRVRTVLLREIKDIDCTPENVDAFWDELPIDELNELNWANLLTQGIGEDWVFLNESLAENTSLLSFKTLYDYDFDNHLFQETANREQCSDYQARDYYALRFMCWARLIINERLYGEFNCDFIFNNKTALQQIRWRHLVADCTLIQANADDVIGLKEQEWLIAKQWLNDNYQDTMQNFDPNVIPLQPKRKILLAPNALDSLF